MLLAADVDLGCWNEWRSPWFYQNICCCVLFCARTKMLWSVWHYLFHHKIYTVNDMWTLSYLLNRLLLSSSVKSASVQRVLFDSLTLISWSVNPLTPTVAISWASECTVVKNYKWLLNPVWHRMLYSCTHMATVYVKALKWICVSDWDLCIMIISFYFLFAVIRRIKLHI